MRSSEINRFTIQTIIIQPETNGNNYIKTTTHAHAFNQTNQTRNSASQSHPSILLLLLTLLLTFTTATSATLTPIHHSHTTRPHISTTTTSTSSSSIPPPLIHPIPERADSDAFLDGHVSLQQIVLQPPTTMNISSDSLPLLSVEVALFTVHLSRPFAPKRNIKIKNRLASQNSTLPTTESFADSDLFPEEYESSAEGLTRLACGVDAMHGHKHHEATMKLFESFPRGDQEQPIQHLHHLRQHHAKRQEDGAAGKHEFKVHEDEFSAKIESHHVPDIYLYPMDSIESFHSRPAGDYVHPLYELLHPLLGSHPNVITGGTRLRYALLMNMEWIPSEDGSVPAETSSQPHSFSAITEDQLASCSLHFLPESRQSFQPSGYYADFHGKALRGSISFVPVPSSEGVALDVEDVEHVFEIAQKILPVPIQVDEEEQVDLTSFEPATISTTTTPTSATMFSLKSKDGTPRNPAEVTFLATEAHMMFFGELAKSLTTSFVKPAASAIGGALNGQWFDQVKEKLFQTTEGSLSNEIPNQLLRAEDSPTTYEIVKDVADQVGSEFPPMLSESLVAAVTPTITETLTKAITNKCLVQLTRSNAFKIGKPLVKVTMPEILMPTGHILTKSLALALTPVILHTLDATPHMDYYCYFCTEKQLYCQYCSYAPKQIYYANYYAGFYSTYYANYYVRFAVDAWKNQRVPLDFMHKTQILGMPDDGIEIVIPADETMSSWKEEERRKGTQHFSRTLRPQDKA